MIHVLLHLLGNVKKKQTAKPPNMFEIIRKHQCCLSWDPHGQARLPKPALSACGVGSHTPSIDLADAGQGCAPVKKDENPRHKDFVSWGNHLCRIFRCHG